jgi:hypothetical protein
MKASIDKQKEGKTSKGLKEAIKAYGLKKHQYSRYVTEGMQTDLIDANNTEKVDFERAANQTLMN